MPLYMCGLHETRSDLRTRTPNPFLQKAQKSNAIRWRTGPAAGTLGLSGVRDIGSAPRVEAPNRSDPAVYKKDPRGRKPKPTGVAPRPAKKLSADLTPEHQARAHPDAGKLSHCLGSFFAESNSGWGSSLDMLALAHGPVGCGVFTQASRLNLPGYVRGSKVSQSCMPARICARRTSKTAAMRD